MEIEIVEHIHTPDAEADALRHALIRLQQDNYALQQTLSRTTDERDYWRNSYMILAEQAGSKYV